MPGWHDATAKLEETGAIRTVGIIQEQHPDRARLFMQWKQMDWPILVDSFNLLGVAVVPITLFIDEHGVVSRVGPRREDLTAFLETKHEASSAASEPIGEQSPDAAQLAFRRGVQHRMNYDSGGAAHEFRSAVEQWSKALDADPNQYIWRRRLQQYGPRLGKPYPFYDWVAKAREEIVARGEMPVELTVEPVGGELAAPERVFRGATPEAEPDPDGKVIRDDGKLVHATSTMVPARVRAGATLRVHLDLRPVPEAKAHWNNEARGTAIWVDPPEGWAVDRHTVVLPPPGREVSEEPRRVELELKSPDGVSGPVRIPAYALYYVCEGVDGACLYRRQDLDVTVEVAPR